MLTINLLQSLWQIYSCCALFYESDCKHRCKITYLPSTVKVNTTGASGGVVVSVGVIRWKWVVLILRKGKWDDNAPSVAETLIMLHLGHLEIGKNGNWSQSEAVFFRVMAFLNAVALPCCFSVCQNKNYHRKANAPRFPQWDYAQASVLQSLILFIYLFILTHCDGFTSS